MRFRTGLTFDEVTKARPEKGLTERVTKSGGRNNRGESRQIIVAVATSVCID
jgi:ribosomal protein L2